MSRKPTSKEDNLFREALQLYESKHYKKSIKNCDTILKKSSNPNFVESLSLKALNLYNLKEKDESESYVKKVLDKSPNNPVANHILGILRRSQQDYKEAAKFFKLALDNGSTNKQIWRDLSVMETQIRDYKSLSKSRHAYLEEFIGYRANWTSLSIAHHLNNDFNAAELTLSKFENLVKDKLNDNEMFEHYELQLYKNQIIYESGDVERALKDLNDLNTFDKLSELEYKGKYYLKLNDFKNASKIFRTLLKRNPDNINYYNFLEISLKTLDKSEIFRDQLYEKLASFYPKSDPPKFIPLFFTTGELFEKRVSNYLISQLKRGVPSTFANIKPLYKSQPSKIPIIEKIILNYFKEVKDPLEFIWTSYFLSQHYLHLKELDKSLELIDAAIKHTPTLVELYILKARVLKHLGKPLEASEFINKGRLIDLQDRFINSKTVKYYLRSNEISKALEIISIFTKNDENCKNGLKDLHTMQVNWFLIELAESYLRLYKESSKLNDKFNTIKYGGLSIKRFKAIVKIFEEYYNDQLDFHTYSMRRGTARAYIEMLKWEDSIFKSSVYTRAVKGISKILLQDEIVVDDVKLDKKEKASRNKQMDKEKSELIAYDNDEDVFGLNLYNSENWIKLFQDEFFNNLLNQDKKFELISTNDLNFKLNFRLKKVPILMSNLNNLKVLTDNKYEYLDYYLLLIKNEFNEGLNKILLDKLLVKFFPDYEFKLSNRFNVDYLISLALMINAKLINETREFVTEKAKQLEPYETQLVLQTLE